jgi:hypothetical protein
VLVDHPDARRHRVAWSVEVDNLSVENDLALVGVVQPEQHVHERGLPCAVLAEQRVDLPRLDDEVDGVACGQTAEALGDAPQLEFHDSSPLPCVVRRAFRQSSTKGVLRSTQHALRLATRVTWWRCRPK